MASTILIVDDDESQRQLLSSLVERLGYQAELVASGEDALARLTGLTPTPSAGCGPTAEDDPKSPGSAFEREGCVRIGYANSPAILAEGLERVRPFLRSLGG